MKPEQTITAIGLMSGTSMDGVDAAMVVTDGVSAAPSGPAVERPYNNAERRLIRAAIDAAAELDGELDKDQDLPPIMNQAADCVVAAHVEAVEMLLEKAAIDRRHIAIAGFHGQTVLHRPHQAWTLQIGDGAALAAAIGIDVVSQFRLADMAAGGEGAPLAPLYHQALAANGGLSPPWAVLNLGGVGNVTFLGRKGVLTAFDTGPGNALIDDWMQDRTGQSMDRDGALAATGRVDEAALSRLMRHDYFNAPVPKSLDRNSFSSAGLAHLSDADGAATLAAFTVRAVDAARAHLPEQPQSWIICGGGRRNNLLMRLMSERLPGQVLSAEQAGWRGDFIEAEAFAFLAVRACKGLPLSEPGTTGVPRPVSGGVLHRVSSGD